MRNKIAKELKRILVAHSIQRVNEQNKTNVVIKRIRSLTDLIKLTDNLDKRIEIYKTFKASYRSLKKKYKAIPRNLRHNFLGH